MIGIWKGLHSITLFSFQKLMMNHIILSVFGMTKHGEVHAADLTFVSSPFSTNLYTSSFTASLYACGTF